MSLAGVLEADVVTTVTLDERAYNVTVTTDGAEIWFTTDGSNPDYSQDRAHRVPRAGVHGGALTAPVTGRSGLEIKLLSRGSPGYVVSPVPLTPEETGFPEAAQSGASVAWDAVETESISLTTTGGDANILVKDGDFLNVGSPESFNDSGNGVGWGGGSAAAGDEQFSVTFGEGGAYHFRCNGSNGTAAILAALTAITGDVAICQPGDHLGFFGAVQVAKPVVPLTTPTAQDVIDALVVLGLIGQSD